MRRVSAAWNKLFQSPKFIDQIPSVLQEENALLPGSCNPRPKEVGAVKIEIAVQGSLLALSRLRERLQSSFPVAEVFPDGPDKGREGRICLVEDEKGLDEKLLQISRAMRGVETDLGCNGTLEMRVRNLAYSEPPAGSESVREPFCPIPSLTVQPWSRSLSLPCGLDERSIVLDMGNAFGTGKHPTSRLCLEILARAAEEEGLGRTRVLDFGCGTGLLAIAAVKMGAPCAVGVEIDELSCRTARRNVSMNGLAGRVEIRHGSWETVRETYDLVLANVVPAVLLRTGNHIPPRLRNGAKAVLSGFAVSQLDEMSLHFQLLGLTEKDRPVLEGWAALVMSRMGSPR